MDAKIALITGASQGIGAAVAKGLAKDGFQTILIARNLAKLTQLKDSIVLTNSSIPVPEIYQLDVTNSEKVERTIENIIEKYGKVSVLVNNAGICYNGTSEGKEEDLRKMLEVNLIAPFVFMKKIASYMKKEGDGHIFNISSRSGKVGFPESGLYSASKFGINGLSEAFYRELSEYGVNITSICPGWVNTDMAFEAEAPIKGEEMIQPDDIMKTIRYVLSLSESVCLKEIVIESKKSIA